MGFKLAIDGPAASGKSTISSRLAKRLGWTHIDTGSMYRAVTLIALERKLDLELESSYDFVKDLDIKYHDGKMLVNGRDVSVEIREPIVNDNVSLVSSFSKVRRALVALQQKAAASTENAILDGRDIGTVVLPNADLKVFLIASVDERAKRRYLDFINSGEEMELSKVKEDLQIRDKKDSTRKDSPLVQASDAILLDTTNLSIDETIEEIIKLINDKRGE
ncbi:MAG: (d)CMP kinase [Acholeplasmataceae bacterium]|jgi:cytidylate kinase